MTATTKIKALLLGCLLLVIALSSIQYDLVRNTYELTKRQYETDIRQAIGQVNSCYIDSANQRMMHRLTEFIRQQQPQTDSNSSWVFRLSHQPALLYPSEQQRMNLALGRWSILQGVVYSMNYSQIVLQRGNVVDTLLRQMDKPVSIMGQSLTAVDRVLISSGEQVSSFSGPVDQRGKPMTYRLAIRYSQQVDITRGQQQILARMSRILLTAISLLVAVILLFYSVFQTLFRQKRLADILTDFTNNMTHELKTPLTSIAIIIKSLKNPLIRQQPTLVDELVQSLERQQQKLHALTDQVLVSSLTDSTHLVQEKINIKTFLSEMALDVRTDTHRLSTAIASEPIYLKTDPVLLRSVVDNLIDNALKYSPSGTEIQLKSELVKGGYLISVQDQGMGIAPQHQRRIFDKFYRIPERNIHTVKGMGLGLYLCQIRIRQLGGRIWVQSTPGVGSIFSIQLPTHGPPHLSNR